MPVKKLSFPAVLALIAVLAAIFVGWATFPYKLGVAPDSISYLSIAKHIAAGKGVSVYMANESTVSKPITAWAPLYPFVLAATDLAHWDFKPATWTVQLVLLGLNIFMAAYLIYRFTQNRFLAAVMALFMALDPRTQSYHSWILSEPVFILLIYLALFFLWRYFEKEHKSDLFLSAFFLGLSPLARYVGAVFIPAAFLSVLLNGTGTFLKKLKKAIGYGMIASVPIFLWGIRNWLLAQYTGSSAGKKTFGSLVHEGQVPVPLIDNLKLSFLHIQNWIAEYWLHSKSMPFLGLLLFIVLTGIALFKLNKKIGTLLLFIFTYLFGLAAILKISLFSLAVPDRYVYPVYAFIFMLFLFLVNTSVEKLPRGIKIMLLVLALGWSGLSVKDSLAWANQTRQKGADESKGARWAFVERIPWFPRQSS